MTHMFVPSGFGILIKRTDSACEIGLKLPFRRILTSINLCTKSTDTQVVRMLVQNALIYFKFLSIIFFSSLFCTLSKNV